MEKAFSPGFQNDIAELLDICLENHTDNITIDMQYPSGILEIELTFRTRILRNSIIDGALVLR